MSRYLCIRVTLLDGRFHGQGDDGAPEWPPSPWRLYQALLAGGHAGCRSARWSDAESATMRWLAERKPPNIVAPEGRPGRAYTLWVPNNDHDVIARDWVKGADPKKSAADLRTAKIVRPTMALAPPDDVLARDDTVAWLYVLDDDSAQIDHVRRLAQIASGVHSLGWGVDAAVASVNVIDDHDAVQLPGQRWEPAPPGVVTAHMLRTPKPNALDELTRCYESFTHRLDGGVYRPPDQPGEHAFNLTGYHRHTQTPARRAAVFALRAVDGNDAWFRGNPTLTNRVAAMVRHVACELAKLESDRFPGGSASYVRGKINPSVENPPRFSYLPLPTIGTYSDGLIRRVVIAEQAGGDGTHAAWAAQRLRGASLIDEQSNQPVAIFESMPVPDSVARYYIRPSRQWSTVTPVILPGFDDHRPKPRELRPLPNDPPTKAERLLFKALQQTGLYPDAVAKLVLRKAPFWPGSHHPDQYRRPDYLDKKHNRRFPAWHVQIVFREQIPGPLALGAGRHCGFGLMAGLDQ